MGIKFVVQAFDAPKVLSGKDCNFPSHKTKPLIKAWLSRLEEMSNPNRQMFTHIILFNSKWVKLSNLCFDCSPEQLTWYENTIDAIVAETREGSCGNLYPHDWFDQLLFEAGRDGPYHVIDNDPRALMDRHQGYGEHGPVELRRTVVTSLTLTICPRRCSTPLSTGPSARWMRRS